jgi:aminoglycoside phosphotransferase (APT) family kinase protein
VTEHANDWLLTAFANSRFGYGRRALAFRPKRGRCVSGVIALTGGQRIFLKRDAAERSAFLEQEAAVLTALSANGSSQLAPRLIDFDPEQRLLITESVDGYVPLDRHLRRTLLADSAAATAAGLALSRLHEHAPEMSGTAARIPFPLAEIAPLTPEDFAARPAGYAQLAAVLHQSRHAVEKLRSRWRHSHFIHGDFKADNLLLRIDPRFKGEPPIVIVDWEMAGVGDPLWDIGSFVGSLLLTWMQALAPAAASADALAGQDANPARRQIGYFLLTCRHMAPKVLAATDSFAATAFQYAGIFMLHRVAVGLDITGHLDRAASLLLTFGGSLLNHPERAVASLLGGMAL